MLVVPKRILDEMDEEYKNAQNFWEQVVCIHEDPMKGGRVQDEEESKEEVEKSKEGFQAP